MMSSSKPPRRFKPEPFETSTTSSSHTSCHSDQDHPKAVDLAPSFAPANVEAEPIHSEAAQVEASLPRETKNVADTVTEKKTVRAGRRFAPEPVETTHKSNRAQDHKEAEDRNDAMEESSTKTHDTSKRPARRKFLPEPVETTTKSHRGPLNKTADDDDDVPLLSRDISLNSKDNDEKRQPRRFVAEPIETSTTSHRRGPGSDKDKTLTPDETPPEIPKPERKPTRRFKVEVIETATRSRRSGDEGPTMLLSDRTNAMPDDDPSKSSEGLRPGPSPLPPANTPTGSTMDTYQLKPPPLRQNSLHPHYNTPRANTRTHAFKVPSLEAIESSESDNSQPPSLSRSHSDMSELSVSSEAMKYRHPTRRRESVDDKFSGYLLALAARTAEKQLREQAVAAFANDDSHSPVAHYMDTDDSDDEEPIPDPTRRDSGDGQAALREMRQHGEKVYQRNLRRKQVERKKTAAFNVEFDSEVHQDAWTTPKQPKRVIGGRQNDPDLRQMRKAAAPPMLGGDIDFPRCPSPEHARFDVTQGSEFLRNYLRENEPQKQEGLWGAALSLTQSNTNKSPTSKNQAQGTQTSDRGGAGGLWAGFCTGSNAKDSSQSDGLFTPIRTPAVTPKLDQEDPFGHVPSMMDIDSSSVTNTTSRRFPPSPPASTSSQSALSHINSKLEIETRLDSEFPNAFITQVYNYLSLGYPALARKFDEELSKITGFAVEELRQDDKLAEARGYIRLGDDEPVAAALAEQAGSRETKAGCIADEVISEDSCARWRALKLYVREWGRQQIGKNGCIGPAQGRSEHPHRAWGLPARKGSWGL